MTEASRLANALEGRYRVEREVGAGGMATVFLAEDVRHRRRVALKVLRPDLAATLGPDRFIREITIAANLQHPHILPLYDSGEAGGFLYYVMPFVEGQSLREKLMREGELPVPDAVRILRDVADAMGYAHRQGVVHRDLKPENIMLSGRHALVTDFGVAKAVSEATGRQTLTTLGVALGTPAYMAPEQASADPHVDHRADIYALGATAYELLTGRPPFIGTTPQQVLAAHVTQAVEPITMHRSTLPPALAALVMRCLEKKPADRWQTADELVIPLEALLTPSGGVTPAQMQPTSAAAAVPRPRSRWLIPAGVAVAVIALGALAVSRRGERTAAPPGAADRTVAVLYFENLTRDTADQYLADGLTEDLASSLGRVGRLQVKAPSAVRRAQQANGGDLARIGQALGVHYVLEGSLRRVPTGMRVAVRLVDHASENTVWSSTYDKTPNALLDLPAEVARDVGASLTGGLEASELAAATQRPTKNPEAYDAFLRGNFYLTQRTAEGTRGAQREYARALGLDPNFNSARARVAMTLAQVAIYGWNGSNETTADLLRRSLATADSVIRADSLSSDAWAARGYALMTSSRLVGAREAAEKAVALDPSSVEAHNRLGWLLFAQQDAVGAEREARAVLSRDPGFFVAYRLLNETAYSLTRRMPEAKLYVDSAIAVAPNSAIALVDRALVLLRLGDSSGARTDAEKAVDLDPSTRSVLAFIWAATGDAKAARAWFEREGRGDLTTGPVTVLIALGERDAALQRLEAANHVDTWSDLAYFAGPEFDAVRGDARFKASVARIRQRLMVR